MSFSFSENVTEIATICTESGIWQPVSFKCIFDPLAINLKEPGDLGGWVTFGENGNMNLGTIATIGVLATLILLVLVVVIIFFTHRRWAMLKMPDIFAFVALKASKIGVSTYGLILW